MQRFRENEKNKKSSMLQEVLKPLIESAVRRVLREELDYYFEKYGSNVKSGTGMESSSREKTPQQTKIQESLKELNPKIKSKLQNTNNILSKIVFEETTPFSQEEMDGEVSSVLDENFLRAMERDPKLEAVHNALTRDYSAMIKSLNQL